MRGTRSAVWTRPFSSSPRPRLLTLNAWRTYDTCRPALTHSSNLDARARHRACRALLSRRTRSVVPFLGSAALGIFRLRWSPADAVHARAGLRPPRLGPLLCRGRHPTNARHTHVAWHRVPDRTAQDRHPGGSRSVVGRL